MFDKVMTDDELMDNYNSREAVGAEGLIQTLYSNLKRVKNCKNNGSKGYTNG